MSESKALLSWGYNYVDVSQTLWQKITWLCHIDTRLELFREQLVSCPTFSLGQKWFRIEVGIETFFGQPIAWASMHSRTLVLFSFGEGGGFFGFYFISFCVLIKFPTCSQSSQNVPQHVPNNISLILHPLP